MTPTTNILYGMWIALEWIDSKHESGWQPSKRDIILGKISTVGIFLRSDEEKITITHSLTGDYSHSPISIPWSCVT